MRARPSATVSRPVPSERAQDVHADPVDARLPADAEAAPRHRDPVGRGLAGCEVAEVVVQAVGGEPRRRRTSYSRVAAASAELAGSVIGCSR